VNITDVAPAATVTVASTAMRLLPEDTAIVLPVAGATWVLPAESAMSPYSQRKRLSR
jgi:hypothetical protein